MAKISANGATKAAEVRAISPGGYPHVFVMTSDGRILSRWDHPGEGYKVAAKGIKPASRSREWLTTWLKGRDWSDIR